MGKIKRRFPRQLPSGAGSVVATSPDPAKARSGPRWRLAGWRLWTARVALALATPLLLFLGTEAALRMFGAGYPTTFYLSHRKDRLYSDNDKFLHQFYSRKTNLRPIPFAIPMDNPSGTVRIVVLGESAAAGTPEPAYSFGRILERLLQAQHPGKKIEVINAAMRGVNSHILLPVARDCVRFSPDLFVVYMGNNEAVGLHAPGPNSGRLTSHLSLLRAVQWVRSTRVGELLDPLLRQINQEGASSQNQDAAFFQAHRVAADDPRRAAVYHNFQRNLSDICQTARRAGAATVLTTVAANLKDCPPFGSLHRKDLSPADQAKWEVEFAVAIQQEATGNYSAALTHYAAAAALDDHFAELHFRQARCQFQLGQFEQAHQEFVLARDWDALQFRTDSRQNQLIRETAAKASDGSILLVDADAAFAQSPLSDHGLPGERLFHDHVHPTFDGDYLLAQALLPAVSRALTNHLGPCAAPASILTRDQCAQSLALTRVNEAQMAAAVIQLSSQPPFTSQLEHAQRQAAAERKLKQTYGNLSPRDIQAAFATYQAAERQAPDDWQLAYNYARLLMLSRDYDNAIHQFQLAKRVLPYSLPVRLGLSSALNNAGRYNDALHELGEALKLDPESQEVKTGLAAVQARRSSP